MNGRQEKHSAKNLDVGKRYKIDDQFLANNKFSFAQSVIPILRSAMLKKIDLHHASVECSIDLCCYVGFSNSRQKYYQLYTSLGGSYTRLHSLPPFFLVLNFLVLFLNLQFHEPESY